MQHFLVIYLIFPVYFLISPPFSIVFFQFHLPISPLFFLFLQLSHPLSSSSIQPFFLISPFTSTNFLHFSSPPLHWVSYFSTYPFVSLSSENSISCKLFVCLCHNKRKMLKEVCPEKGGKDTRYTLPVRFERPKTS